MSCEGFKILSLMHRWNSKREMMGDDPPYLAVGTEVSAKYKGAFCEAKVRKIVRSVKCKIAYKISHGTAVFTDDQVKGTLRAGSVVEVKHHEKKEIEEATIIKIQDCSQYTVVFDDGDITTLRRTALCLKSGRHFAESETLDQLPLTHPEHFGNPVIGGRRGRRNRHDDSSDDEGSVKKGKQPKEEKEADIGKVVCVEISEKKKQKDNWFPGLVVAPTAQDTVKINVKEDYLVRSFKDGRYYTVPKKEATLFTREIGQKVDNNTLKTAVEKALLFLDREELPPHWDRELLFGLNEITDTDSDGAFDSDTSDDEPREEKDHFVAQLYKFMDDRGTPINKGPTINSRDVDLYKLFKVVHKLGGYNRVTNHNQWKTVSHKLGFGHNPTSVNLVKHAYKKFLHSFEDFYRKLGCTMVNHPRGHRSRHRSNRSLIRDKDKALPPKDKQCEKDGEENKDESASDSIKEKYSTAKDEFKPKEIISDNPKPLRKDSQKTPRNEKLDKKDEVRPQPSVSKVVESPATSKVIKEDKLKCDDREERIKMREMLRHDNNSKDEFKTEKDAGTKPIKETKGDEIQRVVKGTRRELKDKDEKEDEKSKMSSEREVRLKKVISNSTEVHSLIEQSKDKKSRSLFSKITGSRRIKPMSDGKIPRSNKPIGLNSVRQKRTFSERMKAMVKKLKMKTGVKQLKHKSPSISEIKDPEDKKKPMSEENIRVAVPQLTRSKSKEEVSARSEKPKGALEKKPSSNSLTQHSSSDKKPGHSKKRKDDEKSTNSEETLDLLPNYKSVAIGDKLKVYYGPTHESKVTYEAKVLNQKEEDHETLYLVHYTGWNTRYDEWIKRGRIADNLSWSPGRAKRTRQQQVQQSQSQGRMMKRSKSGGGCGGEVSGGGCGRSTTPSSVTSSSSRTKSPAVSGAPRTSRSRGRFRRASGHTHTDLSESEGDDDYESDDLDVSRGPPGSKDIESDDKESKDAKELLLDKMRSRTYRRRLESGCESEDPSRDFNMDTENKLKKCKVESEEEGQFERTRSRSEKRKSEEVTKITILSEDVKKEGTDGYRSDRLRNKRKAVEEKIDIIDDKEVKQEKEIKGEPKSDDSKVPRVIEEKHKVDSKQLPMESDKADSEIQEADNKKRLKRKSEDLPIEEDSREPPTNERRRSRRVPPRKEDIKFPSKSVEEQSKGREFDLNQIRSELKGITPTSKVPIEVVPLVEKDDENEDKLSFESINTEDEESKRLNLEPKSTIPEDIYEFKEPEPFEFEVRSKCSEDKGGKIQRRSFGRVCEESSSATLSNVRKKVTKSKSESPSTFDSRRNTKKPVLKSDDLTEKLNVENELTTIESQLKREKEQISVSETEKNKEESDYDSETEASENKLNSNKSEDAMQPLSLFNDLPEEREGGMDEDSEDRLVISEPETETESQGPLFSHQQRDHEDFFPTSITQSSSVENSQNKSPFSGSNEGLKDGEESKDGSLKTQKEEKEDEDPIMSAIQRVQRSFSQSPGDEDSNDLDLLSELPDPTHRKDEDFISTVKEDGNSISSKESNDSQNEDNLEDQTSQSNGGDSDDNINHPIEISDSKIVEEINIDSSDSEGSVSSVRDDSNNIPSDMKRTEIVSTILKEDTDKTEESQDTSLIDEEEKDCKYEVESEEESDVIQQDNNDNEEKESEDNCSVKEEIVEDTQTSEAAEVTIDVKEDVSEELNQVELNEEVVLETVEVKKDYAVEENEEDGSNEEEEEFDENVEEVEEEENDQELKDAEVKVEVEEPESNLDSLLCEETIPGSPAPSSTVAVDNPPSTSPELPFASAAGPHPVVYKPLPTAAILPPPPPPPPTQAAVVMDNTPPTTPESSLSPISNSPIGERSGSSPIPENDSSKSNRDSSEVDLENFAGTIKVEPNNEEETHSGVGTSNSSMKKSGASEENETEGVKKRRRSVKRTEENPKRPKLSHRSPRHNNAASESDDDTSENSLDLVSLHSRSPRPSKYNFFVQLDPELDASQRIAVLQQKLAELRKTYMSVKAELACIDRRRKKLRRREREASIKTTNAKPEVPCS